MPMLGAAAFLVVAAAAAMEVEWFLRRMRVMNPLSTT